MRWVTAGLIPATMLFGAVSGTAGSGTAVQVPAAPRAAAAQPAPQRPRAVQVMTLTAPWPDGGDIPTRFTQAGEEISPALTWTGTPEGTTHFVLLVHDLDAAAAPGTDDVLHWLVWNIPGTATGLPEAVPHGPTLADGSRQVSVSGPYYRGPGASASGPAHHYVFELYAVDEAIAVPPVGRSPAETRAAVVAAMAGHVRGKAVSVGRFKRAS